MPRKRPYYPTLESKSREDVHLSLTHDEEWSGLCSKYIQSGAVPSNIYRTLISHTISLLVGLLMVYIILEYKYYSIVGSIYVLPVLAIYIVLEYFKSIFFNKKFDSSHENTNQLIIQFMSTYASAVVICYVLSVLMGAGFISDIEGTFVFSCTMATLTIVPLFFEVGTDCLMLLFQPKYSHSHKITLNVSYCVIAGAWFGSFVIPLDWERPWQVWPIPNIIGALLGNVIGEVLYCGRILLCKVKN